MKTLIELIGIEKAENATKKLRLEHPNMSEDWYARQVLRKHSEIS